MTYRPLHIGPEDDWRQHKECQALIEDLRQRLAATEAQRDAWRGNYETALAALERCREDREEALQQRDTTEAVARRLLNGETTDRRFWWDDAGADPEIPQAVAVSDAERQVLDRLNESSEQ